MNRKTWEVCPGCGKSIRVPGDKAVACPVCGARVRPCSRCGAGDCDRCPYEPKARRETR